MQLPQKGDWLRESASPKRSSASPFFLSFSAACTWSQNSSITSDDAIQTDRRPNHSCHTALTELIDTWLSEININKLCGALFIDFAKAFDVISHDLLLKKLTLYGLLANTLSLICSFLNSRLQEVSLKDNQSDFKTVLFGVPQGSVLGRLLFSSYINDLSLNVPSAKGDMLADDKTIHTSGQDVPAVTTVLQSCLPDVVQWTHLNHMSLNPSKRSTRF